MPSGSSSLMDKARIWDNTASGQGGSSGGGEEPIAVRQMEPGRRKSLYVEVFETMQDVVLEHESFLFSQSELACLERLKTLSYPARYLLVRLCLRKRGKWHTLAALEARYRSELGDAARISTAIDELCYVPPAAAAEEEAGERCHRQVIDLTLDDDEEGRVFAPAAGSCSSSFIIKPPNAVVLSAQDAAADGAAASPSEDESLSRFAADDASAPDSELLGSLSLDELKSIARQMKVNGKTQTRAAFIDAILSNASQQSTLNFPVLTPRNNNPRQSTLNFRSDDGKKVTQHMIIRRLVSKFAVRCVRIELSIFALFDRLNLVFFRNTTHSPSLLLPALLAAFRKRRYGSVQYARTKDLFPSRDALLAYERALLLEYDVDELLGNEDGTLPQSVARRAFSKGAQSKVKGKGKPEESSSTPDNSRVENAKAARRIWEKVYDRWLSLTACEDEEKRTGLERFDCGHVLTRIVYKGAQALAILKEYALETEVLGKLLNQKKWRRGRRGAWYDRLALVLMTHRERSSENLEIAMDIVVRGLEDNLTHMIYRPRLERRLTRLERMLKIPKGKRHKCDGRLQKAQDIFVEGVRVYKRRSTVVDMRHSTKSPFPERSKSQTPFVLDRASAQPITEEVEVEPPNGKTIWTGKSGGEVSVEQLALEYYEDMGFKGFHSEGSIVSTIFGLLFWDIIFAPIPGAFETPYQTAPLDIHEDGFYTARRGLIEQRLGELERGAAADIVEQVDERERPTQTLCIGVDWNFERQDIVEIVNCLGGHALGIICRMMCEDYAQWKGGVPDLFVWNAQAGSCKFVEVKSPNDTLSENQKVWIDVLLGAKVWVDLCHVTEKGAQKIPKKPRGRRKKTIIDASDLDTDNRSRDVESGEGFKTAKKREQHNSDSMISPKRRKVEVLLNLGKS